MSNCVTVFKKTHWLVAKQQFKNIDLIHKNTRHFKMEIPLIYLWHSKQLLVIFDLQKN